MALRNTATLKGDVIGEFRCVRFSPDGETLASSGGFDGSIRLWDVKGRKGMKTLKPEGARWHVYCVAFSPDGKSLAAANGNRTITLWDLASHTNTGTLKGHTEDWVFAVAFSPDGKTLASGSEDKTIKLWDIPVPEKDK